MTDAVIALRAFNRFHTRLVGALSTSFMGSGLSLVEARILYEIATRQPILASDIHAELDLDAGYVSRIVARFEKSGVIQRGRGRDARQRPISLTPEGADFFAAMNDRTRQDTETLLAPLDAVGRDTLVEALSTTRALLGDKSPPPWQIRTFQPGDLPLIASRQAILYRRDYGWNEAIEILASQVVTDFLRDFRPGREQCWVAERAGRMLGAIILADAGDGVAQLRLLHVEPDARGLGIGRQLVDLCVSLARQIGYHRIRLWTHTSLVSARRIYEAAGFGIVSTDVHDRFGRPEQSEIWEMPLNGTALDHSNGQTLTRT